MQDSANNCPCCSNKPFSECCQPFILKKRSPSTAEQLMRSRFSAYANKEYQYILDSYAQKQRKSLSIMDLQQSDNDTQWLSLKVVTCADINTVEFKAYSKYENQFYLLHEVSNFEKEHQHWVYVDGMIVSDTGPLQLNRNDQCLCGSGKKYKKCCMS